MFQVKIAKVDNKTMTLKVKVIPSRYNIILCPMVEHVGFMSK